VATYLNANRRFAASVTGVYEPTSVPSGSRNCVTRLPQGIILGSCTTFRSSFNLANSASAPSTWNSTIAVRLAAGSALPSLNNATVSTLPKARVAAGVTISANTGALANPLLCAMLYLAATIGSRIAPTLNKKGETPNERAMKCDARVWLAAISVSMQRLVPERLRLRTYVCIRMFVKQNAKGLRRR